MGVSHRVEKSSAAMCRRLVCAVLGGAREFSVTPFWRGVACLIDSADANLEIRGDVVSSGSGARDPIARNVARRNQRAGWDIFVIETNRSRCS